MVKIVNLAFSQAFIGLPKDPRIKTKHQSQINLHLFKKG